MRRIFFFFVSAFLFSCETIPTIEQVETLTPGQSVVFGEATVVKDGEELEWGIGFFSPGIFRLILLPNGTNEARSYQLEKDGTFYWALDPGNYRILAYEWVSGGISGGRLDARFSVPEGKDHVYIGDLVISISKGRYRSAVKDHYDAAAKKFLERFPDTDTALKKTLLAFDKPEGSYTFMRSVCSEFWGIDECDRDHQGLAPITPEASQGFPVVSSLTPKFEWKPSSRGDITYDFVIYEAAAYSREGLDRVYTPGHIAIYEENLKQSNFTLKQPLKPKQKYYWSVRLRDGQVVSDWSRYGYFSFFVIGMASGYRLWFTFETPDVAS